MTVRANHAKMEQRVSMNLTVMYVNADLALWDYNAKVNNHKFTLSREKVYISHDAFSLLS